MKKPKITITLVDQKGTQGCHRGHRIGDSFDFDTQRGELCPMLHFVPHYIQHRTLRFCQSFEKVFEKTSEKPIQNIPQNVPNPIDIH